ncbi:MAG: LytTR family DNA-binding domain-containing protein [Cyclobacteriaceae bacterium]|nr:LytTR family DNA-binding domain-containing protein [Cyclobacteriaceae bacterium]
MEIKCLIIDDEKLARELLLEYLEEYPEIEVIGQCSSGKEAIKMIDKFEPDLIFLDVQMPGKDGLQVLEEITHKPFVIFSTAYDNYAIQAFEENAVDYLLKPIDTSRFRKAIERVKERMESEDSNVDKLFEMLNKGTEGYSSHLFVQKSDKFLSVPITEILHLEASGDYTIISTANDQFLSSNGIGKLEERLDPNHFIRVHRSTIINLSHLKEIEKHFNGGLVVKMKNGKSFSVSRTYSKEIRKKVV